jgi:hypothetical protein
MSTPAAEIARTEPGPLDRPVDQRKNIDLGVMQDELDDLLELHQQSKKARSLLADALAMVADRSGLTPAVVRRYIAARASENFEMRKLEHAQLSLLFEEV